MPRSHLSLAGVVMSALVGLLGAGAAVYAAAEPASPIDPTATVYFTGRTVAELSGNTTLFEATDPRMSGEFTGEIDEVRNFINNHRARIEAELEAGASLEPEDLWPPC